MVRDSRTEQSNDILHRTNRDTILLHIGWRTQGTLRLYTGYRKRVDDVMKVAGHRLSTAELEDAISTHRLVTESAVVPAPHEVKGEVPITYVVLQEGVSPSQELEDELKALVREKIGAPARPETVIFVTDLPRTRSGKIMRRVLKSLLINAPIGGYLDLVKPRSR